MFKNLEYLLNTKKISGSEIAKKIGITNSAFSQFRNEKAKLSRDTLQKLAKLLNASIEEILDKEELVIKNVISVKHFNFLLENTYKSKEDFFNFTDNGDNYVITSLDREDLKSLNIFKDFTNVISFVYNQNSMSNSIKVGDLIYVDLTENSLIDGIYLINEGGSLRLRRLKKDPSKIVIAIKSDNENDSDWKEYNLIPEKLKEIVYGKVLFYKRNVS